ncbi:zinc ribbon domain-containing protein [Lacrimispora sp.]|uniref:zinc ribbon domain-containing protein n=1 Tax=Lacrimispora sp. TaxID=2719234 RepID=UPI0028AB7DD0|nr:zinc ribbon domain-containing protein [Lacrimispora sp.]
MNCKKCGNNLQENQKFCSVCGEKVEVINTCTKCGTKIEPGQKFCVVCGQSLYKEDLGQRNNPKTAAQKVSEPQNVSKPKKRSGFGKGLLIAVGIIFSITGLAGMFVRDSIAVSEINAESPSTDTGSAEVSQNGDGIEGPESYTTKSVDRNSFMQNAVTPEFKDLRNNIYDYSGIRIKVKGLIIGKSIPEDYMEGVTELAYDANEWSDLLDTYYAYSCMSSGGDSPGGYIVISKDSSPYTNEWKMIYGYPVGVNSKGDVIIWAEFFTDEEAVVDGTDAVVSPGGNSGNDVMASEINDMKSFDESSSRPTEAKYDFGYNTNPDDIRYNQDYFTAGVEMIKNNGFIGSKVNITGLFTYAGTGNSVSMEQWYDSATMKNLDAYYISDAWGEGQYIVLSAYNSNVYADSYVTVYGTVIDIDKNGVVYIVGQLIEAAPAG